MASSSDDEVKAWLGQGCLFEVHRYVAVDETPLVAHAHEEYQFGLGFDSAAEYTCRGGRHGGGAGWVSVVHPGETHAGQLLDVPAEPRAVAWRMCYVPPALVEEVAGVRRPPFVRDVCVDDPQLARLYLQFHLAAGDVNRPRLAQDALFVAVVARLVERHAGTPTPPAGRERDKVREVCAFLRDNLRANPSLDDLARLVGLGRYHLCRAFRRETGLPIHRYQVHARVERARELLAAGRKPAEAAAAAGFADQSHLTRHFKRLVRVTPGRYGPGTRSGG